MNVILLLLLLHSSSSGIAYDTVDFCLTNLEKLCNSTSILTKYFPNLLKVNQCPESIND